MNLTIEQTKIIKGVAILMMVFLHLFNRMDNVELCQYWLCVGDVPLVHWLTRAATPVPFYLFLSGYGLYSTWSSAGELDPWRRCLKLYQVYWVSLLVMVGVGYVVRPSAYSGSVLRVIENATGWNTSYNAEAWFLFPYLLLVFSAKWLFALVNKMGGVIIAAIGFALYLATAFMISRVSRSGEEWLFTTMWAYHPILYIECLCSFLFGAVACKSREAKFPTWFIRITNKGWKIIILLLTLVVVHCIINSDACNPVYASLMILLLSRLSWAEWANKILLYFGKYSTLMWLTHSYFCYYLFHDFIYGFRYPLLVFIVNVGCALVTSHIIMIICKLCRLPR